MTRLMTVAVAFAAAFPFPFGVAAQAPNEAIPREVVMSILRHYDGPGDPEIVVTNQLPPDLAARVSLPPGARVIAILPGTLTQVIGSVRGSPDSIRTWFGEEFERRGFVARVSSSDAAFRPAERTVWPSGYCSGDQLYTVSAQSRPAGMVEFVLRRNQYSECTSPSPRIEMSIGSGSTRGYGAPAFPLLYHPRSAEVSTQCLFAMAGGSERSTTAAVSTSLGADQLLTHYGRQLETAGWVREPFAGAVGSWARKDSTGRDVRVHLSIEPGPGGPDCRRLGLSTSEISP
jgi:hypothetical protein